MSTLTAERVRELLDYEPDTGLLRWRPRLSNRGFKPGAPAGYFGFGNEGVRVRVEGRQYHAHRIAWLWMTGEWPSMKIDHANCNSKDNRWENLRLATCAQNSANRRPYGSNPLKGAYAKGSRWDARITINKKPLWLGAFDTPAEAHAAYMAKAFEAFGEFARAA